jgi:hypothetical protein
MQYTGILSNVSFNVFLEKQKIEIQSLFIASSSSSKPRKGENIKAGVSGKFSLITSSPIAVCSLRLHNFYKQLNIQCVPDISRRQICLYARVKVIASKLIIA